MSSVPRASARPRAARAARLTGAALALVSATCAFVLAGASPALAATFDPNLVISDANMRAADSMSAANIQSFLDARTGMLKTYVAPRHDGGSKATAAVIIAEASRAWSISPKVVLTMLQKEQSLLTRSQSSLVTGDKATLDWAMGMGVPDGSPRKQQYRGFGNQIWYACQSLSQLRRDLRLPRCRAVEAGHGLPPKPGRRSPQHRHVQALRLQPEHRSASRPTATSRRRRTASRATRTSGRSTGATSATRSPTRVPPPSTAGSGPAR